MRPNQTAIDLSNQALQSVQSAIPSDLYQNVFAYINQDGEWLVGMEILIDQIIEFRISISTEQFQLFKAAMVAMGQGESNRITQLQTFSVSA